MRVVDVQQRRDQAVWFSMIVWRACETDATLNNIRGRRFFIHPAVDARAARRLVRRKGRLKLLALSSTPCHCCHCSSKIILYLLLQAIDSDLKDIRGVGRELVGLVQKSLGLRCGLHQ